MLVLEDLRFRYPKRPEEYRFSMTAAPGEITAVTGPSGAGKSTLLDLIAGFASPTSGRLTFGERDLLPLPPEDRPISILFQSELLFEHLTVEQNLALGLPSGGAADRRSRITAALDQVGMAGTEAQRASTLSGGQKQRAALARTLLRRRDILLLDEPFSALDDQTRIAVRELVRRLTVAEGWTTVLISHHQDDVAELAARRYEIANGALRLV